MAHLLSSTGLRWAVAGIASFIAAAAPPAAAGTVDVGPWTVSDRAFVDRVVQLEPGDIWPYCHATDLQDSLVGYSPDTALANIGAGTANDFLLEFLVLPAVNLPGPDIVFFEARWSIDRFEIAVRPLGGSVTQFHTYEVDEFLDTGLVPDCLPFATIYGLEIELDDYGIPAEAVVDAIRIRALAPEGLPGNVQGDPVMAAVTRPDCLWVDPPEEPSARGSSRPLRVIEDRGGYLRVEKIDEATAYNVYAAPIGSWYEPSAATGSACTITAWVDNGDGTITMEYSVPPGSWIVATAANACGESGAGVDSCGTQRFTVGQWERCPPGP